MSFEQGRSPEEAEICKLEKEIYDLKGKVRELMSTLPPEEISNYQLKQPDGSEISLLEMFGDKEEMILIHNMGPGCPYCTLWADAFKGLTPYLEDRCAFWLETDIEPSSLLEFSNKRGWNFQVASSAGSTLKTDLGFKKEEEGRVYNLPGLSTLFLKDNKMYRHATAPFGPGDDYCALWPMLDRLKKGVNEWQPKFNI